MESSLKSVSKIFSEKLYRIPDYQRGYAWSEKQVKDFWADIYQLEDDHNHYVGVVTVEDVPPEVYESWDEDKWIIEGKNFDPFYVVDGQQRLTTTVILIQAICEIALKRKITSLNYTKIDESRKKYIFEQHDGQISRSYIFGYEKDNPSYEYLKIKIFNERSTSGYSKEETVYTNNLEFAKSYFIKKLEELDSDHIGKIFKKITQSLLFNIYSIQDDIDVFIAFETMNNRGLRLSNLELLKNRLIYITTKFEISNDEKSDLRRIINDAWRSIYHHLGKNKLVPLKDDTFLYMHTDMYFGRYKSNRHNRYLNVHDRRSARLYKQDISEELSERLLENHFSAKSNQISNNENKSKLTPHAVKEYAESISSAVEVWFDLKNPSKSKLSSEEEKKWVDKLNRTDMIFNFFAPSLTEFYLKKPTKQQSLTLLKLLEKYAFVCSLALLPVYASSELREELFDKGMNRTADDIISTFTKMLNINMSVVNNPETAYEDLAYRLGRIGFYEWSGIRYFLYEYELSLLEKSKTKRYKLDWQTLDSYQEDYVSVEHIYPQKGNNAYWKKNFGHFTPTQKRSLRDSLGNLVPLSVPKNSSLQNKAFHEKVDNGENVGYRYGSYSENELTKYDDWTPQDVLNRGIQLLNFMEKRWDIKLGDNDKKMKMLKLGFMNKK